MHAPAPDPNGPAPGNRLAHALQLSLQFRKSGRTDVDAFLDAHDELRDLIEPMIRGDSGEDEASNRSASTQAPTAPSGFLPGANIAGYVIERRIGQGGMGTVFLATQSSLGRRVALKVLSAPLALLGERSRWRFQRESRLLAELDHPGIVRVLEAGTVGDLPFYAMEFVDGAPLSTVLEAIRRAGVRGATATTVRAALLGSIGGDEAGTAVARDERPFVTAMVEIAAQVAEALAHAHAAGVVHRDVKPSNVLLRRDGRALLADFGIARRDGGARMTATGDLAGTPTYMSPEQARGETIDHRADVFSLGVMLYECLTLRVPFAGDNHGAVLSALQDTDPDDPREHNPHVSVDLAAVVGKAMQKDRGQRHQTANDFAADLRAVLQGDPVSARRPSAWQRLRRWARREPWRALAIVATALVLVAGIAIAAAFTRAVVGESQRSAAALAELQRLAIGVRLDRAEAVARDFGIARIELATRMKDWLRDQGEPLAAELPRLLAMRDDLAKQALPYDEATAAADRERHPEAALLRRIDDELAHLAIVPVGIDSAAPDAKRRQHLQATADPIRARIAERRTWTFADEQTQFLHDQVAQLVRRLEQFANAQNGTLQRVQRQVAWAEESHRRCQVEGMSAWQTAAASISASKPYLGLVLKPQLDLLPLGPDPKSGLWEFVHLRSGVHGQEIPPRDANGVLTPTNEMGIVFVLIPGGLLTMGAQAEDPDDRNYDPMAGPYEAPVHTVELGPFFLAKFEVTQNQWLRLTDGAVPSLYRMGTRMQLGGDITPRHPVESISHREVLRVFGQHGLVLPTEAQWEYACRAGTTTPWYFATREEATKYANIADATAVRAGARWQCEQDLDDGYPVNAPVGHYLPNAFGLHDTLGNVKEITADYITQYTRPTDPGTGRRQIPYDANSVLFRGGSHGDALDATRAADRRMSESTDYRSSTTGVRAARAIER